MEYSDIAIIPLRVYNIDTTEGNTPNEKELNKMKRYSVSKAYSRDYENDKIGFQYDGRTDDVEQAIKEYKERLQCWIECITDENDEYRAYTNNYHGIRITDSKTKEIVYEETHIPEEYGWKKEYIKTEHGYYASTGKWLKV